MMSECYLADVFGCADSGKDLIKAGHERIKKIINSSKLQQDNIYLELEGKFVNNENSVINCHRNCVSTLVVTHHQPILKVTKRDWREWVIAGASTSETNTAF